MIPALEEELDRAVVKVEGKEDERIDVDGIHLPDVEVRARWPQIVSAESEYVFDPVDGSLERGLRVRPEDGWNTLGILAISIKKRKTTI